MEYRKQKINTFKDLIAWQEAHKLVLMIYDATKTFPKSELFGLTDQMRRAAVSTTSNIAEGFTRQSYKEKIQFYSISAGSITEIQSQLEIAKDLQYISPQTYAELNEQSVKAHKILNGLISHSRSLVPNSKFKILNSILLVFLLTSIFYFPYSNFHIPYSIFYSVPTALASTFNLSKPANNLKTGLVGWWTFDGKEMANGKATDGSGNGNSGSPINIATSTFYTAGKIGQALNFDGVNDYVNAGTGSSLNPLNAITISAWIYPKATAAWVGLVSKSYRYPFAFEYHSGGLLVGITWSDDSTQYAGGGTPTLNKWNHAVANYDSTTGWLRIYLNGVQTYSYQKSPALALKDYGSTYFTNIGGGTVAGRYFTGLIDDVRIYNRALSPGEIRQLYNLGGDKIAKSVAPVNTLKNGLVGYWTFDGKDMLNGAVKDMSGNGNTGNLVNIATSTFYTAGKIGQGFRFDGVNDAIDLGQNKSFLKAVHGASSSAWIRLNTVAGLQRDILVVTNNVDTGTSRSLLYIDVAGKIGCGGRSLDADAFQGMLSSAITAKVWHHVACVLDYSGNTVKIYLDGVQTGSTFSASFGSDTSSNTTEKTAEIGSVLRMSFAFFSGLMDDVRIYNRALSATEVKQLYNLGGDKIAKTVAPVNNLKKGLVGYWTFDGKDMLNGAVLDKSGNYATGTPVNIATSTFYTAGKIGQGFRFDGVNDAITAPVNLSVTQKATLSFWSYWNAYANDDDLLFEYTADFNSKNGFLVDPNNSSPADVFAIFLSATGGSYNGGTFARPSAGAWHQYVILLDRTTGTANGVTVYVDGVAQSMTQTQTGNMGNAFDNSTLYFMNRTSSTLFGSGKLDDVRIYNRALSATEIKQLYNLGR